MKSFAPPPTYFDTAAVASDGSFVSTWGTSDSSPIAARIPVVLHAQLPGHASVVLSDAALGWFVAAAPGGAAVVTWWSGDFGGQTSTYAAFARPGGLFSDPVKVADGQVTQVAMDAAGEAVVAGRSASLPENSSSTFAAFAPSGGSFGDAVTLPGRAPVSLALGAGGETALVTSVTDSGPESPGAGVELYTREGGGPVSAPEVLAGSGPLVSAVAADKNGRLLAVWPGAQTLETSVRGADGVWSTPRQLVVEPSQVVGLVARTSPLGDAVIAWRQLSPPGQGAGTLQASVGSLADGQFSAPSTLAQDVLDGPSLSVAADGSALVTATAFGDPGIRVARRVSIGPFVPATVVACDYTRRSPATAAGFLADGTAALAVDGGLMLPTPGDLAATGPVCTDTADEPAVTYSQTPVTVGVPVTLTAHVRRAGADVTAVEFSFGSSRIMHDATDASVTHTFTKPGIQRIRVTSTQIARDLDATRETRSDTFSVDVFARASLKAMPERRRRILRRGIIVEANAFTSHTRVKVALVARTRGHVVGHTHARLGASPRTVGITLTRDGRSRLRRSRARTITVALKQPGRPTVGEPVRVRGR